jgi:glycosyltransferase involved in cell wall biosynthesis
MPEERRQHKVELSVVLTANRLVGLSSALTSVAEQTTDDFELICVADKLGDEGVAEFMEDSLGSLGMKVPHQVLEASGGSPGPVRNAGFEAAKGSYVAYLDGDDTLSLDAVEVMLSFIRRAERPAIFSSAMSRVDAKGGVTPLDHTLTYQPAPDLYSVDPETLGHGIAFLQLVTVAKENWGKYPFRRGHGEDIDFMLHQLLLARYVKVPSYLYYYRDAGGSFSKRVDETEHIHESRLAAGYYEELFRHSDTYYRSVNFGSNTLPHR